VWFPEQLASGIHRPRCPPTFSRISARNGQMLQKRRTHRTGTTQPRNRQTTGSIVQRLPNTLKPSHATSSEMAIGIAAAPMRSRRSHATRKPVDGNCPGDPGPIHDVLDTCTAKSRCRWLTAGIRNPDINRLSWGDAKDLVARVCRREDSSINHRQASEVSVRTRATRQRNAWGKPSHATAVGDRQFIGRPARQ